ncbi:MAG TPA: hypothetical protein V6D22_00665 [Candidatus Obscuribacterales bacterium]
MNLEFKRQSLAFAAASVLLFAQVAGAVSNTQERASVAPPAHPTVEQLSESQGQKVLLKGGVSEQVSPIAADGSKNEIPLGATVNMTMLASVNSEVTKPGDDVVAMVSIDMKDKDGKRILLPGQWCVHGMACQVEHQKRLGRDGFVTVHFDKLVSPDGKYQIPIDALATTHESTAKAVSKVVAKDSVIVTKGAAIGAVKSVQFTGIPLAVATHGYSVAAGAALGATIGLAVALHRKGKITCGLPGEELKFHFDKPVVLPAFNAEALPSAVPAAKIEDLDLLIADHKFLADPYDDKSSRLLRVTFRMINNSDREYSFTHLVIVSDHNKMYYPYVLSMDSLKQRQETVKANCWGEATITFGVDSPKRKYWLVLLDSTDRAELTRVPIN